MLGPFHLRVLLRPSLSPRSVTACCLLATLALLASGALQARSVGGESNRASLPAIEDTQRAAPELATPPDSVQRLVASEPTRAPAAPAATPTFPPTAVPSVDRQAQPPTTAADLPSWGKSARETGLWSEPADGMLYSKLPDGSIFRVLDRKSNRLRVYYPGDRGQRKPGEAWVDASDVVAVAWPRWVRLRASASLMTTPSVAGAPLATVRPGAFVEVLAESRSNWARVNYMGDGRGPAIDGWLDVGPVAPIPGPDVASSFALSYDLLANAGPEVWLKVPYRSQIDGTPYAEANCGPTVANMVLESFGFSILQPQLRKEVLSLQPAEDCDDCGVYLQNLAEVIGRRGLTISGLRDDKPNDFHHWTQAEIKRELRAGRPVIAQVYYRRLPARSTAAYWGDHFIVLTGIAGDRFIFNDPIDVEGPGYGRLITSQALDLAMGESDYPYAAFSVGR